MSIVHYNILQPKNNVKNPPLLVMLHGYGSDEKDLFSFANLLNDSFLIVSARAPRSLPWGGYAWYNINFENPAGRFGEPEEAEEAVKGIENFVVEMQQKYNTNPAQTVLLGFSQGAILSYAVATKNPEKYSAVLALSGYVFKEIMHPSADQEQKKALPIFASHGTADPVIPVDWARKGQDWLNEHGFSAHYNEYEMQHGINQECFEDMMKWIAARYPKL